MLAELARSGGNPDDSAKTTAQATQRMAELFPVLIQQTDPRNMRVKSKVVNLTGSQMDVAEAGGYG